MRIPCWPFGTHAKMNCKAGHLGVYEDTETDHLVCAACDKRWAPIVIKLAVNEDLDSSGYGHAV